MASQEKKYYGAAPTTSSILELATDVLPEDFQQQLGGQDIEQVIEDRVSDCCLTADAISESTDLYNVKGPVDRLDYYGFDPLDTLPSKGTQKFAAKCNLYSLSVIWPTLTPASVSRGVPCAAAQGWFTLMLSFPVACYAMLYGSFNHRFVSLRNAGLTISKQEYFEGLRAESQTIQSINATLSEGSLSRSTHEALILSVLCMASNARDETVWLRQSFSPFNAPLKGMQCLDIYGTLVLHPLHAQGLNRLVQLVGGLKQITTPGLAATISYSGIIEATRSLRSPVFPFVPLIGDEATHSLQSCFGLDHDVSEEEFRFSNLDVAGLPSELADVLRAMQIFECTISAYSDGLAINLDLALICDQRNLIMHTLMSLPSAAIAGELIVGSFIYETLRLAAILYGIAVIFPLPTSSAPFNMLVKKLLAVLQNEEWVKYRHIPQLLQLELWVLTIAGMASECNMLVERLNCITLIRQGLIDRLRFPAFLDYKRTVLKPILWLDIACDAAGERLWNEIVLELV